MSFVAGGHLTQPAIVKVYSGVVSICSIYLLLLTAELNNLEIYQADARNVYLEANTKEKIFFITGKEFATFGMEGHVLIMSIAFFGLCAGGKRYHEVFSDTLHVERFRPGNADSDVWMRCNGDVHKYVLFMSMIYYIP